LHIFFTLLHKGRTLKIQLCYISTPTTQQINFITWVSTFKYYITYQTQYINTKNIKTENQLQRRYIFCSLVIILKEVQTTKKVTIQDNATTNFKYFSGSTTGWVYPSISNSPLQDCIINCKVEHLINFDSLLLQHLIKLNKERNKSIVKVQVYTNTFEQKNIKEW
jgi:hypothetical protein